MATILIPPALRPFTGRHAKVVEKGKTVGQVINALSNEYPDLIAEIYDINADLRSYIDVFVGEINVKKLQGMDTPIGPDDTVRLDIRLEFQFIAGLLVTLT
jgi:adenylyltransferase/sulfurtransferase